MHQDPLFEDKTCPECGHRRRTYRRTIHKEMAKFMAVLLKAGVGVVVDIRKAMPGASKASTDASYLVYWGFVDKPGRGLYSLTSRGRDFMRGENYAPKYIYLQEGQYLGDEGLMTVGDIKGFDLSSIFLEKTPK